MKITRTLIAFLILVFAEKMNAQPWSYDFGTGTGTHTSSTASTSFLPTPTSGTSRVRVGTNPGSIVMANAGLSALGTSTELQITSNTSSSSTTKFSVYDYTTAKTGYVKFKIAFSGGTNGVYRFWLGDGATFSDNIAMATGQTFAGIEWALGASNTVTYQVLNSATWGTTGISGSTTLFAQSTSTVYQVEVYANNTTASTNYYRNGTSYTLTNAKWDLWVDGTRVGTGLAKGGLGTNANFDSYAFNHQVSATAPGTIYLDDIEYANDLPKIVIADNGTQVSAANVAEGTNSHILHQFKIDAVSGFSPNLTGMTCTTAGGYDAADISNLKVRYSTDATLDGGDATLSTLSSPGAAGAKTFPSFTSQTITGGTSGYIFITADIASASASGGNTISCNAISTSNLTFSSGIKTGTTNNGGTQTIIASATISTSTISPTTYCAGDNVSVAYTSSGSFSGTFTAQLSDASGDFTTPTAIGTGTSPITATLPTGTTTGTGYRIRVVNNTPSVNGSNNGTDITINNSTTTVSPTTTQNISVSTNGTILSVSEGSSITSRKWRWSASSGSGYADFSPAETGSAYTPNFASAGTYYVVCESTYPSPCGVVTTTSSEVQINVTANTISTSAISGSPFCSGATVSVPFTYSPAGNFPSGGSCTFTAELSDALGSFVSPTAIGTVVSTASGSQTITATIPGGTTTGTGYRIRVTSNSPTVTGADNGANLTINTTVTPSVSIASSPAAVLGVTTICAGTSVTFTATPTNGGGSPTYQWKLNGGNVGTNSVTYSNSALTNTDVVTCEMTSNAACPTAATVTSNTITMTVNALVTPAVSIVSSPAAVAGVTTICSGTTVTFTPTPTNGGASPTYNWWKNGVGTGTNLGTSATYSSPTLADADAIACVMTSNATCTSPTTDTSNTITITNNTPATPTFTTNPNTAALGQTGVVYTVTSVSGVTYNWSYSGTGATITGTGNSVTVDFSTIATSGNIYVVASKSGCLSSPASVAVTVSASAASDIQFNSGSSASNNTNIDYTLYQGTTLTNTGTGASGSVGVMGFTVRDGAGTTDADGLGTDLSAITFSVTNSANIRNARIFNGSSPVGGVVSVSGGNLTFTGLTGLTTTDGGTLALNLRVTFNSTVTDNQKMVFTVASASTGSASSTFATGNAGGAYSDNNSGNDINRIEVTADRIRFVTQPTDQTVSVNIATFSIKAVDINNLVDLDATKSVTITTSGTGMSSSSPYTLTAGTLDISDVQFGSVQGPITLTATTTGYTDNDDISSSFNISSIATGSYRTTSNCLWSSTAGNNTGTWQVYSGGWQNLPYGSYSNTYPATNNSTDKIYIFHTVTLQGTNSVKNIVIENGGILSTSTVTPTFKNLLIKNGGTFNKNPSNGLKFDATGILEVEDGGTFNYSHTNTTSRSTNLWNGTEKFHPNSNFVIKETDNGTGNLVIEDSADVATFNGAKFGNFIVDMTTAGGKVPLFVAGLNTKLTNGDFILRTCSDNGMIFSNGNYNVTIGGNLIVESTYTQPFTLTNSASTVTFTVNGNVTHNGTAEFRLANSQTSNNPSVTLNIDGNLTIGSSNFNFDIGTSSTGTNKSIVNLKGNLATGSGNILTSNSNTSKRGDFNFTGTSNTIQTIDVASTGATTENARLNFNVKNGAYVQLVNRNFELGQSSKLSVENAATCDFGFSGATPLLVAISGSQTGTGFESLQGSTLKITSPDGITTTTGTGAGIGNVQVPASNRTYDQVATFHYIGKANQVTGNGITSGSTAKIVIAELASNSLTLTPSNNIAMSSTVTLDPLGGKLDIRKGIVVETSSATITGSGRLVMTDGVFRTSILSTTLPQLSNYSNYSLTGGTVELNGNGSQTISGAPIGGYYKIAITEAGTKSVTSAFTISKNLTITNGVFDPTNNAITGNAGLTMTGGTFRMSKTSETLPQLEGIDSLYSISGGTVELYGTSSSQTHSLRGTYNGSPGTNVNYYNVELNATGANVGAGGANVVAGAGFGVAGTMNVNSPACFQLGSGFTITDAGTSTFEVKPGATFKYGGSIATSGASGNVRTDTRTFPTTASYGFVGSVTPQDPGTGLPSSMVNMYLDKENAGNLVTITQDEEMTTSLAFYKGIVKTNSSTVYVSNTSTTAITGGNTSGTDKYVQGNLKRKTDGASTYTFPIGHSAQNAQGFSITPTGTSGSDVLGYLETNGTTPVKTVAYCDLETKTAPGQQIGQGSAGADGALDQVVFNLASPLQWDITNPGGGITSYNVTVNANGGQDINPVTSASGTPIRYLLKNGEPGNTGFTTASGGADYPTVGFIACPNQYTLSGMTSFSKFTVNGANAGGTGLPVKLIYFTGKKVENYSQLDWATAIEIDNDKFIVERSGDAVHFETIGSVQGAGNTTVQQNYQWLDKSPLSGWNYYRLKQVDFDGDVEYTNTVAVNFDGDEVTPSIIVFPSPSKDFINIQVLGTNQIVEAVLYNMIGQAVKNVTPNSRMSIEDLPSGEYFIKVIMGNNVVVKQFVKE